MLDLINEEITVCSPRVMNDPYDTLFIKWGEFFKEKHQHKKHVKPLAESFESYRIRSFCKMQSIDAKEDTIKNKLMWSHYGGDHYGLYIQYEFTDKIVQREERSTINLLDVKYCKPTTHIKLDVDSMNTEIGLQYKSADWEYENEVRLVTYYPDFKGDYMQVPLKDMIRIKSIYFGYRCSHRNMKTIKNILSHKENIKYYKMKSSVDDVYHLFPVEMTDSDF